MAVPTPPHDALIPDRPPLTPELVEREYDNRARVPGHPAIFARWERDSRYVRETLPCRLDLPYGPDPRQRIDFFPAPGRARGTLLFIHGGYWRSLDKSLFSWLAASWVAAGIHFALANYRLCPAVRIPDIVSDLRAATHHLLEPGTGTWYGFGDFLGGPLVVSGHSAGGHLAAALLAEPPGALAGAVAISGICDFEPLRHFSLNADLGLDEDQVAALDLHDKRPAGTAPLVVAVGGEESAEFRRQSRLLAERWAPRVAAHLELPGADHFTVLDGFAERGQPLYEAALALFPR